MVPWTPRHHWEGPSIASLQRDIGKGGSSCCFVKISSKTPMFTSIETKAKQQDRSLPAPRPTGSLQHPEHTQRATGADSEPWRAITFCMKTLANEMTSLQAGSLIPCRVSCGLQRQGGKWTGVQDAQVFLRFCRSAFCYFFQKWRCWSSAHKTFGLRKPAQAFRDQRD